MFNFKGFLTKDKNTHLEHLEDDIINRGAVGGDNAINFLKSVRNMLAGTTGSKTNITVKWDGAPAIICGINPELSEDHRTCRHQSDIEYDVEHDLSQGVAELITRLIEQRHEPIIHPIYHTGIPGKSTRGGRLTLAISTNIFRH